CARAGHYAMDYW
nr:immunoglobulin heavy chain junction region [Mus musculus]